MFRFVVSLAAKERTRIIRILRVSVESLVAIFLK